MLPNMINRHSGGGNGNSNELEPPSVPFASANSLRSPQTSNIANSPSTRSLSANYLPTKFSDSLLYNGFRRRNLKSTPAGVPKRGGGREAFKAGEARMPGVNDEDYDGVQSGWFGNDGAKKPMSLKWNRFKWILFGSNVLFSVYALAGLIFLLCTWFDAFDNADVIRVGNRPELILSTIAVGLAIVNSLIGWAGLLLNNRAFLAVYTFLLWICFAFLVTPGYVTYKKRTFNLEGKINAQWSEDLGINGWLRIQNQLKCCGYFSPFVEAAVSQTCYARSVLQGCKGPYMDFERMALERWYTVAFACVPLLLFNIIVGLLCSNHVTYRFGKGMMPKAYRLDMNAMALIMDNYANELAEQYGPDFATDVLTRSRSNVNLQDSLPTVPYSPAAGAVTPPPNGAKYNVLNDRGTPDSDMGGRQRTHSD